jgi:hypothetical protein
MITISITGWKSGKLSGGKEVQEIAVNLSFSETRETD